MTPLSIRTSVVGLGAALALSGGPPAEAQYFATPAPAATARPAPIPKSGPVTISPALEAKVRSQVTIPSGFDLTVFAGAPVAMYPTCVAEGSDGAIYGCADPDGSTGRIP